MQAGPFQWLAFDTAVLERYLNDPRYRVEIYGFSGWISISDDFYDKVEERDSISIQGFGYARNANQDPAIGVFTRYLSGLSPEHRHFWNSYQLQGDWFFHPHYESQMMEGTWDIKLSVYDAILEEIAEINKICDLLSKPHLFRETFEEGARPRMFGFITRPTYRYYNEFVLLMDKLLSDNIDLKFFGNDVDRDETINRRNGQIQVRPKGSLHLLGEWLHKYYHGPNGENLAKDVLESLQLIRNERNNPAHRLDEDRFDRSLIDRHRKTIEDVYNSLSTLRMIFASHPKAKAYQSPEHLVRENVMHV